jgi:hypothetical protein
LIRKTAGEVQYEINRQASGDGFRAVQQVQNFYGHATSANTERYLRIKPGAETEIARQHGDCVRIKFTAGLSERFGSFETPLVLRGQQASCFL